MTRIRKKKRPTWKRHKLETAALQKSALDLLARREHSRWELEHKLSRKADDADQLSSILDNLQEQGLQSDTRFCESYVRYRQNAGFGPVKIKAELLQRGVEESLISDQLSQVSSQWHDQLLQLVERKYASSSLQSLNEKAKCQRFLAQRGFSFDQIRRVLADYE